MARRRSVVNAFAVIVVILICYTLLQTLSSSQDKVYKYSPPTEPLLGPVYKSVSDLTSNLPNPESKIPRILHQTYKSTLIPNAYREYVTGCLSKNDGWQYYLWQDSDLETFVRDRYPFMWKKIEKFHTRLQKSDVLRYMILHYYGGIYIDMDVECVKPFFPSLAGHSAFIDQERREHSSILYGMEYSAMNSAMGSIKGHPFFAETIKELLNVSHDGEDVLGTTGPHMLTRVYKRWMTMSLASQFPVTLLRPEVFSPMVDSVLNDFRAICKRRDKSKANQYKEKLCNSVLSNDWRLDTSDSTTVGRHRFTHLAYSSGSSFFKGTQSFDVTKSGFSITLYNDIRLKL